MGKPRLKTILLNNIEDYKNREVLCKLDNGHEVRIVACREGFEQIGGTTADKYATIPIAEEYNGWLHPYTADRFREVAESLCDGLDNDVWDVAERLADVAEEHGWNVEQADEYCTADSCSMFDVIYGVKDFNPADFVCK